MRPSKTRAPRRQPLVRPSPAGSPGIRTKSIHTEIEAVDGLRILVARYRGRGIPAARYDVWMPNLGPREPLLRSLLNGKISWPAYKRAYLAELWDSREFDRHNATIKNHGQKFTLRLIKELSRRAAVTLLCHCAEAEQHCHRHVLRGLLDSRKI
jgi:uncharacterized protein YeaO (DUF488 family)